MRIRTVAGQPAERLQQAKFLVSLPPFAKGGRQAVESFCRFARFRQQGFQRLDVVAARSTSHPPIGGVGINNPPLGIGHDNSIGMTGQKAAGQFIGARLRHDLDKADQ
ncbi:hypothetical protein D3C80_1117470 [compost metagenome]